MAGVPIDLNADVGEGLDAADEAILPLITSANIACGGHAGDQPTMGRVVQLAIHHDVAIGAHPAYPDREGFGRHDLDISSEELRTSLVSQIRSLMSVARSSGAHVTHVKPHGALYNRAAADRALADLVADVVRSLDPELLLIGLAGSQLLEAGRAAGLAVAAEGFADRAYEPDGSLRSRSQPGAVLERADEVAAQAVSIAADGRVRLDGGGWVAILADTLCLHGDSPGAVENAAAIRSRLVGKDVEIRPMRASLQVRAPESRARVVPYGERAFLIEFEGGVDELVNDRVHEMAAAVEGRSVAFGAHGAPVAGYASLLVTFDPEIAEADAVRSDLEMLAAHRSPSAVVVEPVVHRIPVRYGGDDGPDLERVAERVGLSPDEVIGLHTAIDYRVFMLGFSPGFGYLGPLPEALRLPRLDEPRLRVPAGSVAIAGSQTAAYPHQTAGGWHILGRTESQLWDPTADRPALLRPGDRVHFERG